MIKSKEIKKAALVKLDWKKAFLVSTIFVLANTALSYALLYANNLTQNAPILHIAVNIIYLALFIPLSFGFISSMTKLAESKLVTGTTIFNDAVLNFSKTISIFFRTIFKMLLPSIIIIASGIGILFLTLKNLPITSENLTTYSLYIGLIYFIVLIGVATSALPYALSSYILADNKKMTAKEITTQSALLMENQKWNFVKLILSFVGWFILLALITSVAGMAVSETVGNFVNWIGLIILMPYLITSIRIFYEECNDKE